LKPRLATALFVAVLATGLWLFFCSSPEVEKPPHTHQPLGAASQNASPITPIEKTTSPNASGLPAVANTVEPKQRVLNRVTQVIGDLKRARMTPAQMSELWRAFWPGSLDEPLSSSRDPEIAAGKRLPTEFSSAMPEPPFASQVQAGNIVGAQSADESAAVITIYLLHAAKAAAGGGDWGHLLLERANTLPPCRGDLIVAQIVSEAVVMIDKPQKLMPDQMESWLQIPRTENAVYRNLAIFAFEAVCSIDGQRAAFYEQCLAETDRSTLALLIPRIERTGNDNAPRLLHELLGNPQVAEDQNLRSEIEATLKRVAP